MATTKATNTTVGISISGIDKISAAIDGYKANLTKKAIAVAASSANVQKAVKGTNSEKNIASMNKLINTNMKAMLDNLDQYKEMLSTLKSKYKTNDEKNNTFVGSFKSFTE